MTNVPTTAGELDLTVFVACFNEEANILATLDTLQEAFRDVRFSWEILVIDDGSEDRTVERVEEYIRRHPRVPIRLIVNETNRGLAQNYIEGAFLGRGEFYRLVCGDNVEDATTLRQVFSHIGKADMVIFYHGDNCRPLFRRILSRIYTGIVNFLSGYRLRYYNGCAIHHRYNVMRWHTNYHGFGFQADLICRLLDQGFDYIEVPIRAVERAEGHSKALNLKNLLSVVHTFLDLSIRRIAKAWFRRKRVRPRFHERLDLHAASPAHTPALAASSAASVALSEQRS